MNHLSLKQLLDTLTIQNRCHICIHDVSGILSRPMLLMNHEDQIHDTPFCALAKSTQKGYDACIRCKDCANHKAIRTGKPFAGLCTYGMFETVWPVRIDGKTVCIIYLCNMILDHDASGQKLLRTCLKTDVSYDLLLQQLEQSDQSTTPEQAMQLCRLIDSYIRLLYEAYKDTPDTSSQPLHWAVRSLRQYADANYTRFFTLESVCRLYFINEKYAGRLFKKQVGMSFHEYLTKLRLRKATRALLTGEERIIDIAMNCGFQSIPYFNRCFLKEYGISPGQYRERFANSASITAE